MAEQSKRYDVVVAGAGPSGLAAAVTAARNGMHTLLVEQRAGIGGSLRAAMHTALCGLYGDHSRTYDDTLNPGIQREITTRLHEQSPEVSRLQHHGPVRILPFEQGAFSRCWKDIIESESDLELHLSSRVTGVRREGARVRSVALSGDMDVPTSVVIDATGDCAVAEMTGLEVMRDAREERQLGGYAVRYDGLGEEGKRLSLEVPYYLGRAAEKGDLPDAARYTMFSLAPAPGVGICKLAVPVEFFGDSGAVDQYVGRVQSILADTVPELAGEKVTATSPGVVRRDGPRLCGQEVLHRSDVVNGVKCGGVRAAWPIEFWHQDEGPKYEYPPEGEYYEIPAECLISDDVENLVCTGRAISATSRGAASLRVSGICIALGEMAAETAEGRA